MEENILELYKEIISDLKRASKRNFIITIILLVMLFASNIAWLVYENQYETVTDESITQEQQDTNNSNMSGVIN